MAPTQLSQIRLVAKNSKNKYGWEHGMGQREATQVEDRGYVVFCGNAHTSSTATTTSTSGSFQTWGEDRGMRFAAVPYHRRTVDRIGDDGESRRHVREGRDDKNATTNQ